MDKKLINAASRRLELLDVALVEHTLNTDESEYYFGQLMPDDFDQQTLLHIEPTLFGYQSDDHEIETFVVRVSLGVRLVASDSAEGENEGNADRRVYCSITATYRAEYVVVGEVPKPDALFEFASCNAVHNVYPFWRELVSYTARNARLPPIQVPLYKDGVPYETVGGVETTAPERARTKRRRKKKKAATRKKSARRKEARSN